MNPELFNREVESGNDDVSTERGGFWEARNERVKSPEFQETMDREKQEFREQLSEAKNASTDFLYNGVVKKVLWGTVKEEARSAFSGKYNMVDSFVHTTGRIADASLSGIKAVGKIAKATGKATKIGARYLFGK
jgi:hypothetical protein